MKHFVNTVIYILIIMAVLFVGFWGMLISAFAGTGKFYFPVILTGGVLILVFSFLHLFRFAAPRIMKRAWLVFLTAAAVSCAVFEGQHAYHQGIYRMRSWDVDLYAYAPFAENTRAARLDGESTLRFADSLAAEGTETAAEADKLSVSEHRSGLPRLDGATAMYPLYAAFAQAVYPESGHYNPHNSEVVCSGTPRAYENLTERRTDIIFAATPSVGQLEAAKAAGVSFRFTPIGREAFVFFVNSRNPVDGLTTEQLRAVYSGEIKNWRELGGRRERIRAFQRNEDSGSQTAFVRFMAERTIMEPRREDVVRGMGGIVSQTADYANYGNAIGFSFRFYVNEMLGNSAVKLLKVDGVYPDMEGIADGTYPLSDTFYAVTLEDNDDPAVARLLEWITSEQGQSLVAKTGYTPTK